MLNVNPFSNGNIDHNADLAVLIMEYSHSDQRKYCMRKSAPSLEYVWNGYTF